MYIWQLRYTPSHILPSFIPEAKNSFHSFPSHQHEYNEERTFSFTLVGWGFELRALSLQAGALPLEPHR
jgi:hypothetical protein